MLGGLTLGFATHLVNNNLITVPQLSLTLSAKAISASGPTVWKSFPNSCKQAELVTTSSANLNPSCFTVNRQSVYSV